MALSLLAGAALADLDLRRPRHLTDCLRGDVGNQSRSSLDHLLLSLGAKQRETPGQSSRSSWCAMPSFFRFVLQHCTSCSELLIIMPRHCSLDAYMAPLCFTSCREPQHLDLQLQPASTCSIATFSTRLWHFTCVSICSIVLPGNSSVELRRAFLWPNHGWGCTRTPFQPVGQCVCNLSAHCLSEKQRTWTLAKVAIPHEGAS